MNVFYIKKKDRTCERVLVWTNIATGLLRSAITFLALFGVSPLVVHLFLLCVCYIDEN